MNTGKKFEIILLTFLITGSLYFIFVGLVRGKAFFIPLVTAIILAMVMNPVASKLKKWGLNKGLAVLISDLIIVVFIGFLMFLMAAQGNLIAEKWPQIEKRMTPKVEKVQNYFNEKLNMQPLSGMNLSTPPAESTSSKSDAQQRSQQTSQSTKQAKSTPSKTSSFSFNNIKGKLTNVVRNVFGFLSNLLLILIYVFFFMYYQNKFEQALLGFVKEDKKEKTRKILHSVAVNSQQYLFGRFVLILILAAFYFIGFSIVGLQHAIFISLLAALLSLVPYVGNIVGLLLAFALSVMTGGSSTQLIGIVAVFVLSQFIESYLLEPFIVGGKVDVNPVVVIIGVVLGGMVWGLMGMLLSIPILGILQVVFNNIKPLRPLGYVLDDRDVPSGGGKGEKAKQWIKNKIKKMK